VDGLHHLVRRGDVGDPALLRSLERADRGHAVQKRALDARALLPREHSTGFAPVEDSTQQPLEGHQLEDRQEARAGLLGERQQRLRLIVEDVVRRGDRSLDAEVELGVEPEPLLAHAQGREHGTEEDQEEVLLQEVQAGLGRHLLGRGDVGWLPAELISQQRLQIAVEAAHGVRLRLHVAREAGPDAAVSQELHGVAGAEDGG
jgi:hypothetical protein